MPAPTVNVLAQNYDIDLILPDLMTDEMEADSTPDPLLEALPIKYEDADAIRWNQWENGYGLLSLRGLGGEPDVVQIPGFRESAIAPGYYGERAILDETEMTKNRKPGTPNLPASPEERLGIMTLYQAEKSVMRVRQTISNFLLTGSFTNVSATGAGQHSGTSDSDRSVTTGGAGLGAGWAASPNTAVPLNDLKYIQNQLQIGTELEVRAGLEDHLPGRCHG